MSWNISERERGDVPTNGLNDLAGNRRTYKDNSFFDDIINVLTLMTV